MRRLYSDANGVTRFRGNTVVRFLLDEATAGRRCDMNDLWLAHGQGRFARSAMREFYQLIGYSVSGYGDIFRATERDRKSVARADALAGKLKHPVDTEGKE